MAIEIRKRKDGVRYRSVIRVDGQKISKTFLRKTDATSWEHQMLVKRSQGDLAIVLDTKTSSMSLDQLRERFVGEYATIQQSPSTTKMEQRLYELYVRPFLGDKEIHAITKQDIQKLITTLWKSEGVSAGRVNRTRQILGVMFNLAIKWDLLNTNPIVSTDRLPEKKYEREEAIHFLTQSEAADLLKYLKTNDPWLFPKVLLLINTGMRYGEMRAMRIQDFVEGPRGSFLIIQRSYCRHSKQIRERTKGGRSRMIPLGKWFAEYLKSIATGKTADAPLVWKDWNEGMWNCKFRKHFECALKRAKVTRIRIHDLRHTFAVHFLENGGHIYDLQKLLGHQSTRLTERYSHFSRQMSERSRGIVEHGSFSPETKSSQAKNG
jgi:site-specific recombinase XerD